MSATNDIQQPAEQSRWGRDWRLRHAVTILLAIIVTAGFLISRGEWSPMHAWNRAFADASSILIALSIVSGPLARLWGGMKWLTLWRRETGIYGVLLAITHTVIILQGWVQWDMLRLVGYEIHPQLLQYVMVQHGFGLANIIGIFALCYGLILLFTSNNASQRMLGSTWKFIQLGVYPLWALIVVHVAYFLYMHFQHFHRPAPEPNWLQWPFAGMVILVLLLQALATWKVWRRNRNRGLSPKKALR